LTVVPSLGSPADDRRCAWLLFFFLNAVFILTSTGRIRTQDEHMTLLTTESLALRQTTELPAGGVTEGFYGRYDLRGRPRSAYGFAHPGALVPWFVAGNSVMPRLPGMTARAAGFGVEFLVVLSSATFSAATVAIAFLLFRTVGIGLRPSLLAALTLAFATPIFAYSAWMFSEPLITLLLVAAAYACFGIAAAQGISARRGFWAGLFLGCAVLVRPTAIIFAPVFVLAILVSQKRKGLIAAVDLTLMVGLGATLALAYNAAVFGSPFEFGYPAVAEGEKQLNTFHTPILHGLRGYLFTPGKSIFIFAPTIVLSLAAIPRLWRQNRGLTVLVCGAPLALLLFFSRYTQWEGGFSYGPRYLVPSLTLLGLALGSFFSEAVSEPNRRLLYLGYAAVVVGFAVQVIGIATSFIEAAMNGGYYDAHWDYRMDYNAIGGQLRLLAHYLTDPHPAPAGFGFDRWFVFLYKVGFPQPLLWAIAIPVLLVAIACGVGLYRCVRAGNRERVAVI
jgi:hypothetical protein